MKSKPDYKTLTYALLLSAGASLPLAGQTAAPATPEVAEDEEVITLSPFEVSTDENEGYTAADTLAGNRLNTQLRDIGNAVTVITSQFLKDTGAVNNETLLQYTVGTEVGNIYGNFAGVGDAARLDESGKFTSPNQNTRVRGLTEADNARNYFVSSIPWDGYNVDRVDLQRGPNSILFGQGKPAGLINTGTKEARFKNSAEIEARISSFGSYRASLDLNRVLVEDQLAVRLNLLYDDEKFQQRPAFERDKRVYAAARWEPAFLKKGSARTIIKMNYEDGSIRSNRPRSLPPMDRLTPWFVSGNLPGVGPYPNEFYQGPNRGTYTPFQLQEESGRPNSGQQRKTVSSQPNRSYQPWFANFGQSFGGPLAYFGSEAGGAPTYFLSESRTTRGINTAGVIDGNLAIPFNRQGGISGYSGFSNNAGLPFASFGVYKDTHITDDSIFDFYNNLIDGPNKNEWQNFNSFQASVAQLFFNENAGFDLSYNRESYDNGQIALLSGDRQGIFIDFMSVYSDGTPAGRPGGLPFSDGTPNPNVGRPFLTDSGQFGNNENFVENDNIRATFFLKHDFEQEGRKNVFTRILGQHTLTALVGKDKQETSGRSWQRYAVLDPSYRSFLGATNADKFTSNLFAANPVIYLGPSLLSSSSAAGANIPRPMVEYVQTSGSIRVFDSTWGRPLTPGAAGYVDPAALWVNNFTPPDPEDPNAQNSTQSENLSNYVGWRSIPMDITDSELAPENRDALTTSVYGREKRVTSEAAVWQAHFWDNAIVGTYGIRKDTVKGLTGSLNTNHNTAVNSQGVRKNNDIGQINLDSFEFDPPGDPIAKTSRAYTVVAHLTQFPGIGRLMEKLPVDVTLFYNRSTNFETLANRVDVLGIPIPLPQGLTRDKGILVESKDRRYSFKVNQFTTTVTNGSSNGLSGTWFIGASQAWFGNWANRFEFNWFQDSNAGARAPQGDWELGTVNFNPDSQYVNPDGSRGESAAVAAAREVTAIAGWRAWQAKVATDFPGFYEAWGINLSNPASGISSSNPNGFALSEDSVSKGYEFEFSAQPTKNWRVTFNAAKTKATRENIGGVNLAAFIGAFETALRATDSRGDVRGAGDLRIWWGDATPGNYALTSWNGTAGAEWAARALQEGTSVPELRQWRFNVISTYNFDTGRLKGVYVGGGLRWQDKIVTGYPPQAGATAQEVSFEIENPYYGPNETNVDFWIGYNRRISDRLEWQVQFNLRNAFQNDDLIPITVQPDGSPAGYRIAPAQTFSLSNTLKF